MNVRSLVAALLLANVSAAFSLELEPTSLTYTAINLDQCAFKFPNIYKGRLSTDNDSYVHTASFIGKLLPGKPKYIREVWIQFRCLASSDTKELAERSDITWDGQKWINGSPPDDPDIPTKTKFISLQGKNWSGGGVAMNQTAIDPPELAARDFFFCMVHPPVALCGTAHDVQRVHYPKENALPEVIKLLQKIEFVEAPETSSAPLQSPK